MRENIRKGEIFKARDNQEEIAVVKNFADQAKKAKKLKVQEGAEK